MRTLMRHVLAVFILLSFLTATAEAQNGGLRYTVMVSKFDNRSGWSGHWELGSAWSTILTDQLNQTGRFIVVAESDMRREAMNEQTLGAAGITKQGGKTPVRGEMTPAQLLVKGVITHFQYDVSGGKNALSYKGIGLNNRKETTEINTTLQIVDSTTGIVVASKSVVGTSVDKKRGVSIHRSGVSSSHESFDNENIKTALSNAVAEAVAWMIGQLDSIPWTGTVALVEGEQIYINRGSREGVAQGQKFRVGESKLIRDPNTGEVLDEVVTEHATLQAVRVNDKTTVCKVVQGDATTIYAGMGVRPSYS